MATAEQYLNERVTFREVLAQRNYVFLWLSQLGSDFADWLANMGMVGLVVFQWQGAASDMATVLIAGAVPTVLFAPFAGALVDRWDRRRTMVAACLFRAFLIFLLSFAPGLWQVATIAFLNSLVGRFFFPARNALLPDLVERRMLLAANSFATMTVQFMLVLGPILGGGVVGAIGADTALKACAVLYLLAAFFVALIRHRRGGRHIHIEAGGLLGEVADGFRFLRRAPRVAFAVGLMLAIGFASGSISVGLPLQVRDVLHREVEGMGGLDGVMGLGIAVGALAVARWGANLDRTKLMAGGLTWVAVAFTLFAASNEYAVAFVFMGFLGLGLAALTVASSTIVQENVPGELRGRVTSFQGAGQQASALLSMALAGRIASLISVQTTLIGAGMLLLAIGAAGLWVATRLPREDTRERAN